MIREIHPGLADWLETVQTDAFEIGPVELRQAQIEEFLDRLGQRIDWYNGGETEEYNRLQQSLTLLARPDCRLCELEPWLRAQEQCYVNGQVARISEGNRRAQALKRKGHYYWLESAEYAATVGQAQQLASKIRSSCGLER